MHELEGSNVTGSAPETVPVDYLWDCLHPVEVFIKQVLADGLFHGADQAFRPPFDIGAYSSAFFHSTPCASMRWETRSAVKQT